ncbi:MAG: hypothetical protein WBV94_25060 [Blastocatellia bacterium]
MEVLIFLAILSVIPGAIAHSKGRSFFGWWFLGLLCFLPALIAAIIIKPDYDLIERRQMRTGMKRCPYCAEVVKGEAVVCRYCQRELPRSSYYEDQQFESSNRTQTILVVVIVLMVMGGGALVWLSVNNEELMNTPKPPPTPTPKPPDSKSKPTVPKVPELEPITPIPKLPDIAKPNAPESPVNESKVPDSPKLDVSRPTFSTAGIRFTLNDKRPNTILLVSIFVGEAKADKSLLEWVTRNGANLGAISIPLRECRRLDGWRNELIAANKCLVIIGAKLLEGDRTVYTTFDIPIDDIRTPLLGSFIDTK